MYMQNQKNIHERVDGAVAFLRRRMGGDLPAGCVGVTLGTGLGQWGQSIEVDHTIPYADIPGLPLSTVTSHDGQLLVGRKAGCPVVAMSGRVHLYEGYSAAEVTIAVRALALLGARRFILTNAAGAINPQYHTGGLMCIADHINTTGHTPLRGENRDEWGPRFPDTVNTWSKALRQLAAEVALSRGVRLESGVYVQVQGPQIESAAETRMLRILGGDAVGMSTVQEALALTHMGVELLGISCLTNKNLPDCMDEVPIEKVIEQAGLAGDKLALVLDGVLERLAAKL